MADTVIIDLSRSFAEALRSGAANAACRQLKSIAADNDLSLGALTTRTSSAAFYLCGRKAADPAVVEALKALPGVEHATVLPQRKRSR